MRSYPIYKEIWKVNVEEELDNVRMATVPICSGFAVSGGLSYLFSSCVYL